MATLAQLRARAQQETDNVNSEFISTAVGGEWTNYLNAAYAELYGLLVQQYGNDYYVQTPSAGYTFTTDGVNQFFALPTSPAMFKLLCVDVQYGGPNQWIGLKPFSLSQRNAFGPTNQTIPAAGQTVRLLYIPKLTPLAVDADTTIDLQNDWEEYIVVDAAIRAIGKEESDLTALFARKAALIERLKAEPENRDAGSPASIVDSRGRGSPGMAYRLNGNNLWLIGQRVFGWQGPSWDEMGDGSGWSL